MIFIQRTSPHTPSVIDSNDHNPGSWKWQCFKICGDVLVTQLFESWAAYCVHLAVKPIDIAA